ncbi:MAG: flagellin FliC [Magnetococcales bacterium]|nr:flagellin FliC [Magnetococcales bacterium]MBF0321803.1 flagellin FliC [Magnetococcales bacterium]
MITINTNLSGIMIGRQIDKTNTDLNKSFMRLSSGVRINSAGDDPGGFGMTQRLTAEIRGNNMVMRGVNDAASLFQIADGATSSMVDSLQRMREIAVQASSGTSTTTDRNNLNAEFLQLWSEIDRIATGTTYANISPLMGSIASALTIPLTAYSGGASLVLGAVLSHAVTFSSLAGCTTLNLTGTAGGTSAALSTISGLDVAIASLSSMRAGIGVMQTRLESVASNLSQFIEAGEAARSRILDTDIANEVANMSRTSILKQAGMSVLAQANQQFGSILSLLRS